ncbi:MAG TPA: hypothetical protein DEO33_00225 [Rikenellaceae bacterium]|nr:hypothetical protein [Rikenellaceae bacterium]
MEEIDIKPNEIRLFITEWDEDFFNGEDIRDELIYVANTKEEAEKIMSLFVGKFPEAIGEEGNEKKYSIFFTVEFEKGDLSLDILYTDDRYDAINIFEESLAKAKIIIQSL